MTYKTKIGIAIGVGFGFIIIMAIVMFIFVSNNSGTGQVATSNQTQNTTNSIDEGQNAQEEIPSLLPNTEIEIELSNVSSLGIQSQEDGIYLLKISSELETENIVNLDNVSGFIGYDFQDGILYLAFNQTVSAFIYSIDLNDNSESFITELEYNILNSFYVYNGNIYCVTANNSIYEYNIQEEVGEEFIIPDSGETIIKAELDKTNNILYYMKNIASGDSETTSIYSYNLDDNSSEEIINAGFSGNDIILYNNYLLCNLLNTSFYIYNIESSSLWELGTIQEQNNSTDNLENVAFLDNYIAFSDGKNIKITDYDGNTINNELYTAQDDETILGIEAITQNELQITTNLDTETTRIINFETSTINDVENSYSNILLIE